MTSLVVQRQGRVAVLTLSRPAHGKPLVAAVNGHAHAGGFGVLVACDLAVAAEDATFGLPEAANGLFPFIALATVARPAEALAAARQTLLAALAAADRTRR
jgi:enoyl-CoA hydratase/carnithine racemase